MRFIRKIILSLLIVLVLLQLLPRNVNKSTQILLVDFVKTYSAPTEVQAIFQQACYDCHSNNTNYPWYSNIQPFRFWLDRHIKKGKEDLNFSEFGVYTRRRQYNKLNSIAESIEKGTMPLNSYKWAHAGARLNTSQKNIVIKWINDTRDSLKAEN